MWAQIRAALFGHKVGNRRAHDIGQPHTPLRQ